MFLFLNFLPISDYSFFLVGLVILLENLTFLYMLYFFGQTQDLCNGSLSNWNSLYHVNIYHVFSQLQKTCVSCEHHFVKTTRTVIPIFFFNFFLKQPSRVLTI